MKKEYLKPDMIISLFDTKDVITASEQSNGGLTIGENASIGSGTNSGNVTIPYDKL